jgi:hypothetical protein
MLPIMVIRRTRFRPYLSDSAPILGETKNWSVLVIRIAQCQLESNNLQTHEKTDPIKPPAKSTHQQDFEWFLNDITT